MALFACRLVAHCCTTTGVADFWWHWTHALLSTERAASGSTVVFASLACRAPSPAAVSSAMASVTTSEVLSVFTACPLSTRAGRRVAGEVVSAADTHRGPGRWGHRSDGRSRTVGFYACWPRRGPWLRGARTRAPFVFDAGTLRGARNLPKSGGATPTRWTRSVKRPSE